MADIVSTQIVTNGFQNAVVSLTNHSDGGGEALVKKVDAEPTGPYGVLSYGRLWYPGVHLVVERIQYTIRGMAVALFWEATANVPLANLAPGTDELDFRAFGGLYTPRAEPGATGSILLSTIAAAADDTYSIVLHMKKNIHYV